MKEKIIGYSFLIIGIIIIIYSAISVYSVFTGKKQAYPLFDFKSISLNTSNLINQNLPAEIQQLLSQTSSSQQTEIIPAAALNNSSNIFAHLILMGFMATIGFKISSLGIMLIRPIKVKLNQKEESEPGVIAKQNQPN